MTEPDYKPIDGTLLNQDHVRKYQETDGEVGYLWNGVPALLLTTIGRKSGEPRTTPLIFAKDGADYLVVASQGGAPTDPLWFKNLLEDPNAEIQVKGEHIKVTGRAATDEEKPHAWEVVSTPWPNYNVYQSRTDRPIPVVILTPRA